MIRPTRIVLIRAGKYEYAEVDLTGSVHLVGPNNVGKTTLVNALQFLYVDQMTHMHFGSHSTTETRKYYFPGLDSYVLFECRTSTGFKMMGMRGRGAVHAYEIERFVYDGRYETSDFLAPSNDSQGRVPHERDVVNRHLAVKGFEKLRAKDLRESLTGVGRRSKDGLGLLPLKNRGDYDRFRSLFKNLLRLARISQDELREAICGAARDGLSGQEVDLRKDYGDQFANYRKRQDEVEDLRRWQPRIENALDNAEKRDRHRRHLAATHPQLVGAGRRRINALQTEIDAARASITDAEERKQAAEQALSEQSSLYTEIQQEIGGTRGELQRLQEAIDRWASFDRAACERALRLNGSEVRRLQERLGSASRPASTIERDLTASRRERSQLQHRLSSAADLVGTALKEHSSEETLVRAFRVLNPDLLDLDVRTDVSLGDREAVIGALEAFHASIEGEWELPGARVHTDAIAPPDLGSYLDTQRLQQRIAELDEKIEHLESSLDAARQRKEIQTLADQVQQAVDACRDDLREYDRVMSRRGELKQLQERLSELKKRSAEVERRQSKIKARRKQAETRINALQREIATKEKARHSIREHLRTLSPPDPAWPDFSKDFSKDEDGSRDTADGDLLAFEDAAERYEARFEKQAHLDEKVKSALDVLSTESYGTLEADSEADTLDRLREEIDGLDQKQQSVEESWRSIVAGLGRGFKNLLQSVDAIRRLADEMNRTLRRIQISDLQRLRLNVQPRRQLTDTLQSIVDGSDQPLFHDPERREKAIRRISEILESHPVIDIKELFAIEFEVTTSDGQTKTHASLDQIESNGTSISIKVLTNLVLIDRLLDPKAGEVRLPFYLDEASSIDRDNLNAITAVSSKLGFVPILASPQPSSAADRLYFPQETEGGKAVIREETMIDVRSESG